MIHPARIRNPTTHEKKTVVLLIEIFMSVEMKFEYAIYRKMNNVQVPTKSFDGEQPLWSSFSDDLSDLPPFSSIHICKMYNRHVG